MHYEILLDIFWQKSWKNFGQSNKIENVYQYQTHNFTFKKSFMA